MDYLAFVDKIEKDVKQEDSASFEEKLVIYSLIRAIKPEVCIETGTHFGKTALYIAHALYDNKKGHLWTVDPNEHFASEAVRYFNRYPELKKFITFQKIKGEDLKVKDIDFAFIDSFHEKEVVMGEIKNLFPRLSKHAIVIFHDCSLKVENMVNEAIKEAKLKTVWIPTQNRIRIYENSGI